MAGEKVNGATPRTVPSLPPGPARRNSKIIRWALGGFAALVAALLILIRLLYYGVGIGPGRALVSVVLAVLPVPLYLALALRVDRYEKEPFWTLAGAFSWGASISFFVALVAAVFSRTIVGSIFGAFAGDFFDAVVSVPLVEKAKTGEGTPPSPRSTPARKLSDCRTFLGDLRMRRTTTNARAKGALRFIGTNPQPRLEKFDRTVGRVDLGDGDRRWKGF